MTKPRLEKQRILAAKKQLEQTTKDEHELILTRIQWKLFDEAETRSRLIEAKSEAVWRNLRKRGVLI